MLLQPIKNNLVNDKMQSPAIHHNSSRNDKENTINTRFRTSFIKRNNSKKKVLLRAPNNPNNDDIFRYTHDKEEISPFYMETLDYQHDDDDDDDDDHEDYSSNDMDLDASTTTRQSKYDRRVFHHQNKRYQLHDANDTNVIEKAPVLVGAQQRTPTSDKNNSNNQNSHRCFMSGFYHQAPTLAPPRTPVRALSRNNNLTNTTGGTATIVSPPGIIRVTQLSRRPSTTVSSTSSSILPTIVPPSTNTRNHHHHHYHHPSCNHPMNSMMPPPPLIMPITPVTIVGDPNLRIYRLRLPSYLIHLLDTIVAACEAHAASQPNGWLTDLYSLTKQDIAVQEIPLALLAAKPIALYIQRCMRYFWNVSHLHMDRNQPHVLKYDRHHVGVELHHDKCDITANLCMSRSNTYVGGGTYFPDTRQVVRLEFGEFILHPGSLLHSGQPIKCGTRHLMVIFANIIDERDNNYYHRRYSN